MLTKRNIIIYAVHVFIVIATAYLLVQTSLASPLLLVIVVAPLILAVSSSFGKLSYTINVRIIFPISVGIFFVCLYHYFPTIMSSTNAWVSAQGVQDASLYGVQSGQNDGGVPESFFQVNDLFKDAVTVLYAICVAFLLLKGLNDFDELKGVLYSEANLVRTISDFATYFVDSESHKVNSDSVDSLRRNLHDYLDNILSVDRNSIGVSEDNEFVLESCIANVSKLEAQDQNDHVALQEMMRGVAELASHRSHRMVCLEKQMSPFILGIVFLMSVTICLSFFGQATGEFSIDYFYIFLLPAFYTSVFMTLLDLSSPFDGYWQIKVDAVCRVRDRLETQINSARKTIGQEEMSFEPISAH